MVICVEHNQCGRTKCLISYLVHLGNSSSPPPLLLYMSVGFVPPPLHYIVKETLLTFMNAGGNLTWFLA